MRRTLADQLDSIRTYFSSVMGASLEEYDEMKRQCGLDVIKYNTYMKNFR